MGMLSLKSLKISPLQKIYISKEQRNKGKISKVNKCFWKREDGILELEGRFGHFSQVGEH
jgi:hypothetical protein